MAIYYYVPENKRPSWGAGMIYYHVWLLNKNNIESYVLHDNAKYKLDWLSLNVPFRYLDDQKLEIGEKDILVIPEFYADLPQLFKQNCKKIIFVQNAFYVFDGLKEGKKYEDLGVEHIFYYMPHLKKALKVITDLPLYETPPFIAPYFFSEINHIRKKKIIVYPKFDNREYIILKTLLCKKLNLNKNNKISNFFNSKGEWQLVELKNKTHKEVAKEMKDAEFFISLNTNEAFNSAVPEAMASGCINICYEGVGPADFLRNEENSFVFPNHHIYSLIEKIIHLITNHDQLKNELNHIRVQGRKTADFYTIDKLENSLLKFFNIHLN